MKKSSLLGSILLLVTAMIWGSAFVVQSVGMDYVEPFTFNAVRLIFGGIVLLPVIFVRGRNAKRKGVYVKSDASTAKNHVVGGIICGGVLFLSSCLQQIGLNEGTSSGKAGFITAFYILLVPLCGLFMKKKVRPVIWLCVIAALAGLYLLCVKEGFSIALSDIYVLLCSFGFTAHILVIDKYSPLVDGVKLSCIQFFVAGFLAMICMFAFEHPQLSQILAAWPLILYAGGLSCGVAYTLQIIAQKNVQPTIASLLMSMESVFAVLAGIVFLGEVPTYREFTGCALMFAAIIIAQLPERKKETDTAA